MDMYSFKSPTVPCQRPTIWVAYSASGTVDELSAQDAKQNPKRTPAMAIAQGVHLFFISSIPFLIFP
jgi:hypothetical protein